MKKEILKELALLVGFALSIFLVLTLIAGVRSLLGGTLGGSLWRLGVFVGAISTVAAMMLPRILPMPPSTTNTRIRIEVLKSNFLGTMVE